MHYLPEQFYSSISNSRGFTLTELMVALVITLILLVGISQIYLSTKKNFIVRDALARQQENGRYAIAVIARDLRRAGYLGGNAAPGAITGSLGITPDDGTCATGNTSWGRMLERRILGLDHTQTEHIATYACIQNGAAAHQGDVMVVRYATPLSAGNVTASDLSDNRLYLRTGLFAGRVFRGSAAEDPANAINAAVAPGARVFELAAHAYYIAPSSQRCHGLTVPSLFREILDNAGKPVSGEVASGIDQLQIRYGIDSDISPDDRDGDGSVDRYLDAHQVADWSRVISARLWLLTRAICPETGYTNTATYTLGNLNYTVNDGFRRQLYQTTVSLRNR